MAGAYTLLIKRSAERELRRVPSPHLEQLVQAIQALATNPRPTGCKKLSESDAYRIRKGTYRVIYVVDDGKRTVEIYKIGHRREVYR